LFDDNGDGRMDRAHVFADGLRPCYGIVPAREGLIAVGAPDIVYLADRDGDGKAEVRETLFTGFPVDILERGINCPIWGPDNWIYIANSHGGGVITGPKLAAPVTIPKSDFRIKADGSAIEPITGNTHTIGHTFTEFGDRFVVSTRCPGIFVAPLPWQSLARNPDVAIPGMQVDGTSDQRVYPTSQPHPWRTRRAEDPGFGKFYKDQYGIQESAPNGYFTSGCSPMVYQDAALTGLRGHLLACEPAQNLVHRAIVERDGSRLTLHRPPSEEQSEFLTSSDCWFHPIALSHAPDGSVLIVDFYREIIEDYSAIPRYLQQEYGLVNGREYGRLWRLTSDPTDKNPNRLTPPNLMQLDADQLSREVAAANFWRRQTAQRLLAEQPALATAALPSLRRLASETKEPGSCFAILQMLDSLGGMSTDLIETALRNDRPEVRRSGLQFAERHFASQPRLIDAAIALVDDPEPLVRLQLAMSVGDVTDPRGLTVLAKLARRHGDEPWMDSALLSSLAGRGGKMLDELLSALDQLGAARSLLEPLCAAIGARRDRIEIADAFQTIARTNDKGTQHACLRGLGSSLESATNLNLPDSSRAPLQQLAANADAEIRTAARSLIALLKLESAEERRARLDRATKDLEDIQLTPELRIAAAEALAADDDPASSTMLLNALGSSTPKVRDTILNSFLARRDRHARLLDAIEHKQVAASVLSAVQRSVLLEDRNPATRERATKIFQNSSTVNASLFADYTAALAEPRSTIRGEQRFREVCAKCHRAHGIGFSVGPDLSAEFQRAEETIIKDLLAPSETITAGYVTYAVVTTSGQVVTGLLAAESPTSLTLRQPEGLERTVLRKDIDELRASPVSLMPEDLYKTVSARDAADIIAWLRRPPLRFVLFDDQPEFVAALDEGTGTAELFDADRYSGTVSLRVTPPQRFSPRIKNWEFKIRQNPAPGEYRYIRFAWKAPEATGVMLEFADTGSWPPAERPLRRYLAGKNSTGWQTVTIMPEVPKQWTVVTRDLWKDFGNCTLTGIAPTTMNGPALFDSIELWRSEPETNP
jgi:putative membrane-bound dehydrogenase-like protein